MDNILITGATGFIGSTLYRRIKSDDVYRVCATVRNEASARNAIATGISVVQIGDLAINTDWSIALTGINVVVHAAGRAHVMDEAALDPQSQFHRVNVLGTLQLARQAASKGVRRFIFISSVGVIGAETRSQPYNENSESKPYSPYTLSKREAEIELLRLNQEVDMDVVIIRPPLVYGPWAPGNFRKLLNVIAKGTPLPLGAVNNRRSIVALDNLIDMIITCIQHPKAANQIFLVSDDKDISTTEFINRIAASLGISARLLPVPVVLLKAGAKLFGKLDIAQSLLGSLQVDISKAKDELSWSPAVTLDEELEQTARWYKQVMSKV